MKRLLKLISIVLCLLFLLTACSKPIDNNKSFEDQVFNITEYNSSASQINDDLENDNNTGDDYINDDEYDSEEIIDIDINEDDTNDKSSNKNNSSKKTNKKDKNNSSKKNNNNNSSNKDKNSATNSSNKKPNINVISKDKTPSKNTNFNNKYDDDSNRFDSYDKNRFDGNAYIDDNNPNTTSSKNNNSNAPTKDDAFTPVTRFVVTGDMHIRSSKNDLLSYDRLAAVYKTAYSYASRHDNYNKLDGIFFTGDNSQSGTAEQQKYFFNYLKENTKKGTIARAVMGNHEFYETGGFSTQNVDKAPLKFMEYSGYDSTDAHITINGHHFIFISLDRYQTGNNIFFSDKKINWLKSELDKAVKDDPNKQIFVFSHIPPYDTVLHSATTDGDKALKQLLNNYPQVVCFAGHTHSSMADPRSVWQGGFTAFNTGSMAYLSLGIPGTSYSEGGYRALDNEGACEVSNAEDTIRNGNMYYIVEIDKNGLIKVVIYDIFTNSQYGEPIILDTTNPKKFKYTKARADEVVKPEFQNNASLKTLSNYYKNVVIDIPLATCKYAVQAYRVEVYQGNALLKSQYSLHGYGDGPINKVRSYINGLQPSTKYTVKVYAISSYSYKSDPLLLDFTTSTANTGVTADILNIKFNSDSTATNIATGCLLDKHGAPQVNFDKNLGLNVATFDGQDDAYSFMQLRNWYGEIGNGFTFETYTYISKKPSSGYVDIVSGQQTGGFGFEYKSNQQLCFYLYLDSAYKNISAKVNTGEWVHLAAVYTGSSMRLYINGSLAAEKSVSGVFKPQTASAQYLCLGADSAPIYPENYFAGKIATAKVYSEPLTSSEILSLYNNLIS